MIEVAREHRWRLPEDAADTEADERSLLVGNWLFLAAIAWAGYCSEGRGTVLVSEDGTAYRPGAPCDCHAELVTAYDPEREAVVAIVEDAGIRAIHVVTGWPAPPDAVRVTPAERCRLTAH